MPLIEINGEIHSVSHSLKMLKSSSWRKIAGLVACIQLTFFLLVTLLLASAAIIQVHTGAAPYQNELSDAISSGVLVTTLHRDIMEAHYFGISGESDFMVEETVQSGLIKEGVSISTDLKTELEEADWGTIFSIYVFAAIITGAQCWRGAQLLRSSCKWRHPKKARDLMESYRNSTHSFRNYLVGFIVGTLLFASEVSSIVVIILAVFWMILCLISALTYGYYKELSLAVLDGNDDQEEI